MTSTRHLFWNINFYHFCITVLFLCRWLLIQMGWSGRTAGCHMTKTSPTTSPSLRTPPWLIPSECSKKTYMWPSFLIVLGFFLVYAIIRHGWRHHCVVSISWSSRILPGAFFFSKKELWNTPSLAKSKKRSNKHHHLKRCIKPSWQLDWSITSVWSLSVKLQRLFN